MWKMIRLIYGARIRPRDPQYLLKPLDNDSRGPLCLQATVVFYLNGQS